MNLKVRYENRIDTVELDEAATEKLWISLSIEEEGLTGKEREERIQKEFDIKFNRPEYNCWHKFDRHHGIGNYRPSEDDGEEDIDPSEPLTDEVADDRIFWKDEPFHQIYESDEATRQLVMDALMNKPEWAEMIIAVCINKIPIREYAAMVGESETNISHKLKRAKDKLRKFFNTRQI